MWWEYPNQTDFWQQNTDFVMFIDENNSASSINVVMKKLLNNEEISPNENVFTVTGCIFTREEYQVAKDKITSIRLKYWKNGQYYDDKANTFKSVCFHSEDIRGRKKAFHKDVISDDLFEKFIVELDATLKTINYKIISINIFFDSYIYFSKYTEMNVYKIAFNFIIERFIYYMGKNNHGSIIFEARGKKEDRMLLEHINKIVNSTGTEYVKSNELQKKITGVYFNKKKGKDGKPYIGLELADISSYPIHRYIKFHTRGRDFETIKLKIIGYPNYLGRGIKIFPKK